MDRPYNQSAIKKIKTKTKTIPKLETVLHANDFKLFLKEHVFVIGSDILTEMKWGACPIYKGTLEIYQVKCVEDNVVFLAGKALSS